MARGFDNEWMDKLRNANDIVSTISSYVQVSRKGRNFWANCPFHHERSPSFCINESDQFYHCFGCGESGDVITFIMKMESLDFMDAVKLLAERANMTLPEFTGDREVFERKKKRDNMLSVLRIAKEYYQNNLNSPNAQPALNYIKQRGLSDNEVKRFEIGYSLGWQDLVVYMKSKGVDFELLKESGVIGYNDNGPYDFFAKRLIFPICNKFGDCIGFSGRDIEGQSNAKYKNSPQSDVFDKSSTIYGLNLVKKLKQNEAVNYIIICEGQMDVIALHKAGFTTAIACLGTALTENHAREISRLVAKVVLCFDGDSAGQNAASKAIPILQSQKLEVRVASLIGGKDPDEIIKTYGASKLAECIDNAIGCTEFQLRTLAKKYDVKDNEGRSKYLNEAFAILRKFKMSSERDIYLPLLSKISGVSTEVLRQDLNIVSGKSIQQSGEVKPRDLDSNADALLKAQRFVIASALRNMEYVNELPIELCIKDNTLKKLYKMILDGREKGQPLNISTLFDIFDEEEAQTINTIIDINLDEYSATGEKYYNNCVKKIKLFCLENQADEIKSLYNAEKDNELRKKLLMQYMQINKEIVNLKKGN